MIRVRFAPSPTGYLHIGSARTFIFNWLYARRNGGTVILRLDDTDLERNTQASIDSIFDGLKWLDLNWDEYYRQSERLELHSKSAWQVFERGFAYRDFTPATDTSEGHSFEGGAWLFNAGMRELSREQSDRRAASGESFVLRFRVPREVGHNVTFKDQVYGEQSKAGADIEDFALLRSNGMPTYHMASCADDVDTRITHIIRGQDHLTNTFKHVLIFDALGAPPPNFAHLPLLIAPDGAKLSKRRHGPVVSVLTYRDAGFLPHTYVNFLCLLGWSPKNNREQMTRQELIETFGFEGINKSNAVVNFSEADPIDPKALWLNSQHMRAIPAEDLAVAARAALNAAGIDIPQTDQEFVHVVDVLRARFATLLDYPTKGLPYFSGEFPVIEPQALEKLDVPGARDLLRELGARLEAAPAFTDQSVEADLRKLAEERGVKAGVLINASRAALTGQHAGPSAFAIFSCIGRTRVVARLKRV